VPWKSSTPMDLRVEFVKRAMQGERVVDLCREYGISRKTGDKFKQRYKRLGLAGLADASRAPKVIPHRTPPELVDIIVGARKLHPTWGPKKLKEVIERRLERRLPSASTVGDILERNGLVTPLRRRLRHKAQPTGLREASAPNEVWCIDYKGQFRLGDSSLCYPLTITDHFSRYILACDGMPAISSAAAKEVCQEVFRVRGLPSAIRSDNGPPFASTGLAGLSTLSVYWMRLGLVRERIRPGHPEENGRHERMHRTLKAETARPPRTNLLQQQERFDAFVEEFNRERPHEALGMRCPSDVYQPSPRPHPEKLADPYYPQHDDTLRVAVDGKIRFRRHDVYICRTLAGEHVGIREQVDGRWIVTFLDLDLGYIAPDKKFRPSTGPSHPPEAGKNATHVPG
jgi:transposase InsO family protein